MSSDDDLKALPLYLHLDPGFVHLRHSVGLLDPTDRKRLLALRSQAIDPIAEQHNNHLLVDLLLERARSLNLPTLTDRLLDSSMGNLFSSSVILKAIKGINRKRVMSRSTHLLKAEVDFELVTKRRAFFEFSAEHVCASTFLLELSKRSRFFVVGEIVNDCANELTIHPYLMGRPTFQHSKNRRDDRLIWHGIDLFELHVDDIDQFSAVRETRPAPAEVWQPIMRRLSEQDIKRAICDILGEDAEKDWGGEEADHYSAHVSAFGKRRKAAFLLKGPAGGKKFRPMVPTMLGKQGDQIYRLQKTGAELLVLQHCHDVLPSVRSQLENAAVHPHRQARFCVIDGRDTHRLLVAYGKLPA